VVLLHGDLGAGKTTLTQGIAVGLGVQDYVQSPTFTLVSELQGVQLTLYHLDLYRLNDEAELESFGYDQYLSPEDGVSVIEWPERAGEWLPDRYLLIELTSAGNDHRSIRFETKGAYDIDLNALASAAPRLD
jgi:tRNA threonylcarbamoyladenosine biosynthesis protein TsaE